MSLRAVSGSGSGSLLRYEIYSTPGTYEFTFPGDVYGFELSGGGGGGGGGGGYAGAGAGGGGGGPAPNWDSCPILIEAGATIDIVVGAKGVGGTIGNAGSNGGESYISGTGILSPFKNASDEIRMGYGIGGLVGQAATGGQGGWPVWSTSTASYPYATLATGNGHSAKWLHLTDGNVPLQYFFPVCQGGGGALVSNNANGSNLVTTNGRGSGAGGNGDAAGGGGGAGGGGVYGRGGNGGTAAGPRDGVAATGNCSGGGGGMGNEDGGDGTDGIVILVYATAL